MSPIRQSAKENWPLLLLVAALSGGGTTVSNIAMNALGINATEPVAASVTAAQMREMIAPIATKLDRMDDRMKSVETYVEIAKDRELRRYRATGESP